ncbi:ATP-grasp domain-containing protein [Methylomicrobium sp. Wu6]|uniref:ATP-grasp domain-containing protein n=1 Tax=Methylomicrobium sp. Wu6 TaxID=3107928 RepID=UPI002DD67DEE|nr:ATP-grasp domain-containing protein [Methylomicrobium sp. Wu6]MEC4748973.1 ATP-grasp domain-containing protein [Methylomicrobium sp. Wu6]
MSVHVPANRSEMLLIIAGSGRMLAEAARQAGFRVLVLDLYADLDTRLHAVEFFRVPSLAIGHVAPVLDDLIERYGVAQVIYGSGLEAHPETLDYLNHHVTILGNTPAVFRGLQNKVEFFATLGALNIPFPEVSFTAPDTGCDWLVKPMQGQGGLGIRRHNANCVIDSCAYWQKFQLGTAGSVLFLADTRGARVIGFNTQFTAKLNTGLEFAFSGLINHSTLSRRQKALISGWLTRCVQAFALKGLNSLDFIQHGEQVHVLEINPRPSASMQLYGHLLTRHIEVCRGSLPDALPKQKSFAGFRVVYADADLRIPDAFHWPDWARDRSEPGAVCRPGQPVCSIIARRSEPRQVLAALAARQQQIFNQLIKVQ